MNDARPYVANDYVAAVEIVADTLLSEGVMFDGTQGHQARKWIAARVLDVLNAGGYTLTSGDVVTVGAVNALLAERLEKEAPNAAEALRFFVKQLLAGSRSTEAPDA